MGKAITIRFSHVDLAGLAFYPRYFEILGELFDDLPFAAAPFAFETAFRRPNELGDELEVDFDPGESAGRWSFRGMMNGNEHFSIKAIDGEAGELHPQVHAPDLPGFRSRPVRIAPFSTDCSGRLQVSRFFEFNNLGVEQWFAESLGITFRELHQVRQRCIPTVAMRTRCRELPAAGDEVRMWIRPTRIGGRSLTYSVFMVRGDECLVENEQVVVFAEAGGPEFTMIDIPASIRECLEREHVAS